MLCGGESRACVRQPGGQWRRVRIEEIPGMCRAVTASVVNVLIAVRGVSVSHCNTRPQSPTRFSLSPPVSVLQSLPLLRTQISCSEEANPTRMTRSSVRVAHIRRCERARPNRLAAKTTDENLTSENWELILNLCDKVQEEGEQG